MKMTDRARLVEMLKANKGMMAKNLETFWRRWAEDLASAGIDRAEVAQSMMVAALNEQIAILGAEKVVDLLKQAIAFHSQMVASNEHKAH
jgi:hypothetical protein